MSIKVVMLLHLDGHPGNERSPPGITSIHSNMKTLDFGNVKIELQLNPPVEETGYLSEDFDISRKPAYATDGIGELLGHIPEMRCRFIIGQVFQTYFRIAKLQKLDYLQKLSINGLEVWCIDDGGSVCLMTKESY